MGKILFIGNNPNKVTSGVDYINKRNIDALKAIFNSDLIIQKICCSNKPLTFINLVFKYMSGLSLLEEEKILKIIEKHNIQLIFIGESRLGRLAKTIKKYYPNIIIITFFHNIEIQYIEEELKSNPSLKNHIMKRAISFNERYSIKYGDKFIVLNNRDKTLLKDLYKKDASLILPTSFKDYYNKHHTITNHKIFTMLFVGTSFFGNLTGLKWFIKEVLPEIKNVKLLIVGKGMDKEFKRTEKIEVYGFVENLETYYYNCDLVVLPILTGGGMKTKTAEAMMYGCSIVGTSEAFEGYDIEYDKIGGIANTKAEMINLITKLRDNKLLNRNAKNYSRKIFLEKYHFKNTINKLSIFFYQINHDKL